MKETRIAILGAGNLGTAIADGLVESGRFSPANITLTRRKVHLLDAMKARGFRVQQDNTIAVEDSHVVIIAVEPHQIDGLLEEIGPCLVADRHVIISAVTGVSIAQIVRQVGKRVAVVSSEQQLLFLKMAIRLTWPPPGLNTIAHLQHCRTLK